MKDNPGLVIGEQGKPAREGDTRNKTFDSRDFTFRFIDRKEYSNGLAFPPYETSNDSFSTVLPKAIKHGLGYPPMVKHWTYDKLIAAGENLGLASGIGNPRLLINPQRYATLMVDDQYIFVTAKNESSVSFATEQRLATHILIGTDNLNAPADETIHVS